VTAAAFLWAGGIGDDGNILFGDEMMAAFVGGRRFASKSNLFFNLSFWRNDWIYREWYEIYLL
jgi:hypothetical protein